VQIIEILSRFLCKFSFSQCPLLDRTMSRLCGERLRIFVQHPTGENPMRRITFEGAKSRVQDLAGASKTDGKGASPRVVERSLDAVAVKAAISSKLHFKTLKQPIGTALFLSSQTLAWSDPKCEHGLVAKPCKSSASITPLTLRVPPAHCRAGRRLPCGRWPQTSGQP